jgi:hypothetical protein
MIRRQRVEVRLRPGGAQLLHDGSECIVRAIGFVFALAFRRQRESSIERRR